MLAIGFIFIWGAISYSEMPRENSPDIEIPIGVVTTAWPGASAFDVENAITDKIEAKIKNLDNLKQYDSISKNGISNVIVEFKLGTDTEKNFKNLRDAVDDAEPDLPSDLPDDPQIVEQSLSDVPIISFALSGDFSWSELEGFSDTLYDEFSQISGVKSVNVSGIPDPKFHIYVDPKKLEFFGLSLPSVVDRINQTNQNISMGSAFAGTQKFEIRVDGELQDMADFQSVVLSEKNGAIIRLDDIAEIRREFDTGEVWTFLTSDPDQIPMPAVGIDVIKTGGKTNILQTIEFVQEKIAKLRASGEIPPHLEIETTFDGAKDIRESLGTLMQTGMQTLIIILVILMIFLGAREAIVAGISIPMSVFLTMIFLNAFERTFNFISLFALVLAIGLLVDNAIILVEGISEEIRKKMKSGKWHKNSAHEAAEAAIAKFRWPVVTGSLTTIFAFLPMLFFISGVNGEFISHLPFSVIAVLIASLIVSLFLLPVLALKIFELFPLKSSDPPKNLAQNFIAALQKFYKKNINKMLQKTYRSFLVVILATALFAFSVQLPIGVEIFPASDQELFTAKVELPTGTQLAETEQFVVPIQQSLNRFFTDQNQWNERVLKNIVFTPGQKSGAMTDFDDRDTGSKENVLGLTFNLLSERQRQTPSTEISREFKRTMQSVLPSFADVSVSEIREGPPGGAPVEIKITGNDFVIMENAIKNLTEKMEAVDGIQNIRNSIAEKNVEISYTIDHPKVARLGISMSQIAQTLNASVNGMDVFSIFEKDDEIKVQLRLDFDQTTRWIDPQNLDFLSQISFQAPSGAFVPFSEIASAEFLSKPSKIEHRGGERILFLRADLLAGVPISDVVPKIQELLDSETSPELRFALGGDDEESRTLIVDMLKSMAFALLLILITLIFQFDSFSRSFVILLLIPFSLTAVCLGFYAVGLPFSFPTMIGIVALAGIIVNDAIVFVDRINQNFKHHQEKNKAMVAAGMERLQPIFLTSITTVLGLLPLVISDPVWMGLGLSIVFGMTASTVLTLVLVPALLVVFDSTGERILRVFRF